jgi:hypothetical protein
MSVRNPLIETNPESPLNNIKTQRSMLGSPNGKSKKNTNNISSSNAKEKLNRTKATLGNVNTNNLAITSESNYFTAINELTTGSYFGEISAISKHLLVTKSVLAVNTIVCGVIEKEHLSLTEPFLREKMLKYNDKTFKYWHKMIKNIPCMKDLNRKLIRELCLNFKQLKFK